MSLVQYSSSSFVTVKHSPWAFPSSLGAVGPRATVTYPMSTPTTTYSSARDNNLHYQQKHRFDKCTPSTTVLALQPEPTTYSPSPRVFEIITPSGKKQSMIFVERVSHITTMVEYGLVPADPKLRKYDEMGNLVGNEGMDLLSPKVYEDTVRGTFFFAERRPTAIKEGEKNGKKGSDEKKQGKKIPTLLEQLVSLGVLKIIPSVRCKSIEHSGACLVRILLSDDEIAHSCTSPRHPYFLYEAPGHQRFKVCTGCRSVPYRRGVYYCSEACLAADWKRHRIECSKNDSQLLHIISMLPTIIHPKPPSPARLRVQTHRPLWYRAWLWMGYYKTTNADEMLDLADWKKYVKERKAAGCKDLLPGF